MPWRAMTSSAFSRASGEVYSRVGDLKRRIRSAISVRIFLKSCKILFALVIFHFLVHVQKALNFAM